MCEMTPVVKAQPIVPLGIVEVSEMWLSPWTQVHGDTGLPAGYGKWHAATALSEEIDDDVFEEGQTVGGHIGRGNVDAVETPEKIGGGAGQDQIGLLDQGVHEQERRLRREGRGSICKWYGEERHAPCIHTQERTGGDVQGVRRCVDIIRRVHHVDFGLVAALRVNQTDRETDTLEIRRATDTHTQYHRTTLRNGVGL